MQTPDCQRQLDDLNRLLEISRSMAASDDLDELLQQVITHSLDLLDVERATLFLYDPERNELVARIATGMKELRVPADKGFCGETIRTQQTLVVPDAYADPRFNPQVDKDTGFRTRNIMSVPLSDIHGQLVGVLQVLNKRGGAFGEYDIQLAETLAAQAGVILQRAKLIEHYLQKQEMERAMQIARDIQQGLLPGDAPAAEGFEIAGRSTPADETGGDIFDFIPLPEGRWALAVADATGHGIGPALVVAETRAVLRASAYQLAGTGADVPAFLAAANRLLAEDLTDGRFVTCFLGVLDPAGETLTFASAGHGPLLFYRRAEDRFDSVNATDLPLGILDDADYSQTSDFPFAPGDLAIITTDGVFEAARPDGEMFGQERMQEQIRRDRDLPAEQIIANLQQAVAEYTRGEPQADDITLLVVKRT